jgi:hypothetical protein
VRRRARDRDDAWRSEQRENHQMAKLEDIELAGHRDQIVADVKRLVEKYRAIFDWDVPEIDQAAADKLILREIGKALDQIERKLLA